MTNGRAGADRAKANSDPGRPHGLLWIVLAAACAGALGESAIRLASRVFLHRPTFLNPQAVWLGPLVNLAVLAVPAAVICLGSRAERRAERVVLLGAWFVVMEVLLLFPRVAIWAHAILALGAASLVARSAGRHPAATLRWAKGLAITLVIAAAVLGFAVNAGRYVTERRALARLPGARTGSPSVVLVVLDAVRARSMGLYGGPKATTPFLARFASRCVNYRRAIAPASWTLPSHASMFTGRWPRELAADWAVPMDPGPPTLAERLAARGYATGAAVGNYLYTYHEFGVDRGFAHYDDYGIAAAEAGSRTVVGDRLARAWNALAHDYVVPGRKTAGRVRRDMLAWMDAQSGGRPVFAFLNWYDAHDPYAPPGVFRQAFSRGEPPTRAVGDADAPPDSAVVRGLHEAYLGAVAYLDSELDSLARGLERRGMLGNTLLIITADHGEEFAEHGRLSHGHTLYLPALHVPLLICPPAGDGLAGGTVDDPVSLRDIAATVLAAAGGGAPGDTLPGHDLLALARATPVGADLPCRSPAISHVRRPPGKSSWYRGSTREFASVVDGRFHLIRTDQGREELFDVDADPLEQHDLAGSAVADSVRARLRGVLAQPGECRR